MIKRIYINNYRSLVAFELKLDSMDVFCGMNGTGKSSVFDAIRFICSLATGKCVFGDSEDCSSRFVSHLEFTSWLNSTVQDFEIEIVSCEHTFCYKLQLDQKDNFTPRVIKEVALCDQRELYLRDLDGVHFDGERSGFSLDWRQVALPAIQAVKERKEIELLQKAFLQIVVLHPNAQLMQSETRSESKVIDSNMINFTSWYRFLSQEQKFTDLLRSYLSAVWEDMDAFLLENVGVSTKLLKLQFKGVDVPFNELSDGERMLVALYAICAAIELGKIDSVLIDEPDNFVALQELEPWFLSISEIADSNHQVLIISHNAEILNIQTAKALFFDKDSHLSPARVKELCVPDGMTPSEALIRGWVEEKGETKNG